MFELPEFHLFHKRASNQKEMQILDLKSFAQFLNKSDLLCCVIHEFQLNLALEKSISGWASINAYSFCFFSSSSDVGIPLAFCCWSNIIFSTVYLVSPSKSDNLEFSGSTFYVLISISPSIRQFHQFYFSYFSIVICNIELLPSRSMFQKLSSAWIFLHHFPSMIGSLGVDFKHTLSLLMVILTSSIFAVVFAGNVMKALTSSKV